MEVPMSKRNLFLSVGALALVAVFAVTYVSQDASSESTDEAAVLAPETTVEQNAASEQVATPAVNTEENTSEYTQANETADQPTKAVSQETE